MAAAFAIRPAVPEDSESIHRLILDLAEFERAPEQVINSASAIRRHGFGANPLFVCWVAEIHHTIVGLALCYIRYSTWKGPVLYLEDLIVQEPYRRDGIGSALFDACTEYGRSNGFQRLSWQVLDWNEPAIKFYEKYGATFDNEWVNCSIEFHNEPLT